MRFVVLPSATSHASSSLSTSMGTWDASCRVRWLAPQGEGGGSAKAGGRPPEGGTRPPEEDKRPRAKGTAAADKPAEEGAKQPEEESRGPRAARPVTGEVSVRPGVTACGRRG